MLCGQLFDRYDVLKFCAVRAILKDLQLWSRRLKLVRMTKPISYHLTTGTFNYVVKDPDCIHLSGQLWIKDEIGISQICVLELDALLVVCICCLLRPLVLCLCGPISTDRGSLQQRVTF